MDGWVGLHGITTFAVFFLSVVIVEVFPSLVYEFCQIYMCSYSRKKRTQSRDDEMRTELERNNCIAVEWKSELSHSVTQSGHLSAFTYAFYFYKLGW